MSRFNETLRVERAEDGFLAIHEHRDYHNGVRYDSTLFVQPEDAGALLDGLLELEATGAEQDRPLRDGRLAVSLEERTGMVNVEIFREEGLPHGGYDVLDLGPEGRRALIDALRG